MGSETTKTMKPESGGIFPRTRWSMVLSARDADPATPALEELCITYWRPIYLYIRSRNYAPEAAEDLTQEFFHRLLTKDLLRSVEGPSRGLLRSFLCVLLKRFLADEYDARMAQKRGGDWKGIPIDGPEAERLLTNGDIGTDPERIFDRQWALDLLHEALESTRADYVEARKGEVFDALKPAISLSSEAAPYAELAETLDMTEGAVKVAVHRLRQRYRACLLQTLRDTIDDPGDEEAANRELQYLISLFSRP